MASRNLGSLTVDLLLRMGGFKEGMDQAQRETAKTTSKLAAMAKEGARLAESLQNPYEKLRATVLKYKELLESGAISQQTFGRAIKQATEQFNAASPAMQKYTEQLKKGQSLTQSLLTPQEKLNQELAQHSALLKSGAINQETYNRAIAQSKSQFAAAQKPAGGLLSQFAKINSVLLGFGVGFSALSIIGGLKDAASKAIEFGDEMQKASAKTGVSVEKFSELAYAAKQTDVPLEALSNAFKKMQVAISNAGSGGKAQLETFRALGVNFEELRKLSPDKQFELLADRIHALQDPADRARAAVELFGKAGADLLPLFAQGAAGLRLFEEEAHRVNATLTDEQATALANADRAIKQLHASWDGMSRTWTSIIALPLASFLDGITKIVSHQDGVVKTAGKAWLDYFLAFSGGPANAARVFIQKLNAPQQIPRPPVTPLLNTGLAPGGHSRIGTAPGFLDHTGEAADKAKKKVEELEEIVVRATKTAVDATSDLYKQLDDRTKTSIEKQLDQWNQFDRDVQALVDAGVIDQAEAAKRIGENTDEILKPIEVSAQRIPEGLHKISSDLSEFASEAKRNVQDILGNFLADPFKDGLSGLVQSFGQAMQQIAAQAVAAKIADKLFSGFDGWLSKLGGLFGGGGGKTFGSGGLGTVLSLVGLSGGGYTGSGGKYQPAGIVHKGEGVLSQEDVRAIGGPRGFFDLLGAIRHGYADGGYVTAGAPSYGMTDSKKASAAFGGITRSNDADRPVVNNFQFDIHAPTGSVSRSTQQQIAAAASRGISVANSRNN